jgi:hypothetical protein
VTQELKLPKDQLYVTVFEKDDEAADIWHLQEGVPRERIYRFGEKDNSGPWEIPDLVALVAKFLLTEGQVWLVRQPALWVAIVIGLWSFGIWSLCSLTELLTVR